MLSLVVELVLGVVVGDGVSGVEVLVLVVVVATLSLLLLYGLESIQYCFHALLSLAICISSSKVSCGGASM